MTVLKLIGHLILIIFLTVITQIGGLIWLFAILISSWRGWRKRYIFVSTYLAFNLFLVPPIASYFGREQLPWFSAHLAPKNWFYPLTFRNYVNPELNNMLRESSESSGIKIIYLDANFPFLNAFPLLPHLSHDDGKKIDLCFMYLDKFGNTTNKKPSTSGYGAYVDTENPIANSCIKQGHWQYDFPKYLSFGINAELQFDKKGTRVLLQNLISKSETQTIFIEPYLKQLLNLNNACRIRFHGCQAVRHDDHIHLQIN